MIRQGLLKTPVQRGFSSDSWDVALRAIQVPTEDDKRLFNAAKFFAGQLEGLRRQLASAPPPKGSKDQQLRRAVGWVNREYLTVLSIAIPHSPPPVSWAEPLLEGELPLADGVTTARPAEVVEALVDGLRFELADLNSSTQFDILADGNTVSRLAYRGNLSILYETLEQQWLDVLHHGWSVIDTPRGTLLAPLGDAASAVDYAVAEYRDEALMLELMARAEGLLARVDAEEPQPCIVRDHERRSGYLTAVAPADIAHEILFHRLIAAEPDLTPFFDHAADPNTRLTIRELLNIWSSIVPMAADLARLMPVGDTITRTGQVEEFAPVQNLNAMAQSIARALKLPLPKCTAAIRLLTWRDNRDSLWHKPLVPLKDDAKAIIVLPALRVPNLRRSIEYWLAQGGNDLACRGGSFEQQVRDELALALKDNAVLRGETGLVTHNVNPSDAQVGDIDLLLWIGSAVLVGEVKCFLRPATSHEWFQHNDKLHDAVVQAKRKASWIARNREWFEETAGHRVTASAFKVLPCVVVNSPRSALRTIEGVPVVDRYIMLRYFKIGHGTLFGDTRNGHIGERVMFYRNISEAAETLADFLRDPAHLRIYRKSVDFSTRPQPNLADPNRAIFALSPRIRVGSLATVKADTVVSSQVGAAAARESSS
jgi:hypothetical protein